MIGITTTKIQTTGELLILLLILSIIILHIIPFFFKKNQILTDRLTPINFTLIVTLKIETFIVFFKYKEK